jgi:hypothetical protein
MSGEGRAAVVIRVMELGETPIGGSHVRFTGVLRDAKQGVGVSERPGHRVRG